MPNAITRRSPKRLPDGAAGQGKYQTGRQIYSDQETDVRQLDPEGCHVDRRQGRDCLELEGHCHACRKQHGKHKPAIGDVLFHYLSFCH